MFLVSMFSMLMRPVLSLLVFGTLALPALALPAPMSDDELTEKSDLVALVRVLSVTCTSAAKDPKTGQILPGYLAKLQVLDVKKGNAKRGDEVLVTAHSPSRVWPPRWSCPLRPRALRRLAHHALAAACAR